MLSTKKNLCIATAAFCSLTAAPIWAQSGGSVIVGSLSTNATTLPATSTISFVLLTVLILTVAFKQFKSRKSMGMLIMLFLLGAGIKFQPSLQATVLDFFVSSDSPACTDGTETIHYDNELQARLTNQCLSTIQIKSYSLPCPEDVWEGSAIAGTLLAANETIELLSCSDFPPQFTLGAPITVAEDSGPQTLYAWISDISPGHASEADETVSLSITSIDNPTLFSSQPAIDDNGSLFFTGADNAWGTANLTITAVDSSGNSSSQSFELSITPVNDAPYFGLSTYSISVLEDDGQDLGTQKTGADFDSAPGGANFTQVSIPNVVSFYSTGDGDADQTPYFNVTVINGTRADANRNLNISASDIFYNGDIGISASGALEFKLNPHHWGELELAITLSDSAGLTTAAQNLSLSISPVWDNEPTGENLEIVGNENSACVPISLVGQSYRGLSQPVFIMTNFTLDGGKSGTLSQDGNPVSLPFTTTNPDFCFTPGVSQYSDFNFTFGTFDAFATFTYRLWSGLGDVDTGQSPSVNGQADVFNELSPEYPSTIIIHPVF
ncbi:hypothetical protein [Gilvimarinus chinensis]|uniref:hypothetical protein n=1 Tax=Gilvimarinus chinensis TaxID=396005 RepID=UPI00036A5766|nr:hypothetical protein [Gilvimarinus chinensis]